MKNSDKMPEMPPELLLIQNKQEANIKNFKDIFDKIKELENFKYPNKDEQQGAIKALRILRNFILNR